MTAPRTVRKKVPTKSSEERKERFLLLLIISLLIHATLILLLALYFAKHTENKQEAESPQEPPPEVTLEFTKPQPSPTPDRPFVEAHETTENAPQNAPFQSDQNTKAASELPATGSEPLPTQNGVTQTSLELRTQRYTPGEEPSTSGGNPPAAHPPSPQTPPTPPTPKTAPQKPDQQKPTPAPTASPLPSATVAPKTSATPQPTPPVPPPPNGVHLLEIPSEQPTPHPSVSQKTAPQQQPQQASPATAPKPPGEAGPKKGFQSETRQTVIMGSISNRGRSSVAAEATPIGRYKKRVVDAIGSRWYYYVDQAQSLISIGTVTVSFQVNAHGRVTGMHVSSGSSNSALTDCSLRSIMDAHLPPIPPDVAATLQNSSLEIDYSFTIYN